MTTVAPSHEPGRTGLTRSTGSTGSLGGRETDSPTTEGRLGLAAAARIVAEREVSVKLRDRTFLISTAVTLLLVVGAFVVPSLLGLGAVSYRVAPAGPEAEQVVDEMRAAVEDPDDEAAPAVEVVPAADAGDAEQLVRDGDADVAIVDRADAAGGPPVEVVADTEVPPAVADVLADVLTTRGTTAFLEGLGASEADVARALAVVEAPQRLLDPAGAGEGASLLLQFAFAIVFFLTALSFGITIAQSVTEEKQQRVVEILVAAVPVRALLIGKILANVALALGQIVLLIAVGLLTAAVAGQGDLVPLLAGSSGWFVVFFVFGFLMLSCLWAASGAMASRVEDLGATTLPIQMFVMLPFFAAVSIQDGPVREVLSYVPFSSPIVMPQRLVAGEAQWWEALVSLGLIVVTASVLVVAAERLYRGSLLRTGGRASLREAWQAVED